MPIDLSSLFRNSNQTITTNTSAETINTQNVNTNTAQNVSNSNALKLLQNMLAGDTFTGTVEDINDNNVLLQLADGNLITARLSEQISMQIGQNVTFLVENNDEQSVTLKPLSENQQENMMISKALDAANYPFTDDNIQIVKELLSNQMPLNAETIGGMVRNSLKFPDTSLNTIANLMKLDIPVTQENVTQFDAYRNFEHSILSEMNQLPDQVKDAAMQQLGQGNVSEGLDFLTHILEYSYADETVDAQQNNPAQQVESMQAEQLMGKDGMDQLKNMLQDISSEQSNPMLQEMNQSELSVKDLLKDVLSFLKEQTAVTTDQQQLGNQPEANLSAETTSKMMDLFNSKEFKTLISQAFDETMKLSPSNVSKEDAISNYYKRVRAAMEHIADETQNKMPDSKLMQNVNNIKNNIDFMNDLNKNMTFVQMPLKFHQGQTNGELYVFTNKKALQNKSDQVSALLHLDMENLGPIDVYVKLAGKSVSTNFCLESEEMLDFVYEHIDELNQRLEELGYSTKFEMKVNDKDKKGPDFVEDFIQKDMPAHALSQYIFDTKA